MQYVLFRFEELKENHNILKLTTLNPMRDRPKGQFPRMVGSFVEGDHFPYGMEYHRPIGFVYYMYYNPPHKHQWN